MVLMVKDREGARWLGYAFVLFVLAFCLMASALLYLWQGQQWTRLAFQLEQLRDSQAKLEEVLHPLDAEAGYLSRPQRLVELADKLGLRPPVVSQYISDDLLYPLPTNSFGKDKKE